MNYENCSDFLVASGWRIRNLVLAVGTSVVNLKLPILQAGPQSKGASGAKAPQPGEAPRRFPDNSVPSRERAPITLDATHLTPQNNCRSHRYSPVFQADWKTNTAIG